MAYGWEGDKIRLVPLDVDRHLENAVRWLNDPEITRFLLVGGFPLTKLAERGWFDQQSKMSDTNVVHAIETLDGIHIGFSGIHQISWPHGTATTGTMIGDPFYWGKGYGTDVVKTRSRYCFEILGLRLLFSACFSENIGSYTMLTRSGYQEYGRIPEKFWRFGKYQDEILLSLHRDRWLDLQGNA